MDSFKGQAGRSQGTGDLAVLSRDPQHLNKVLSPKKNYQLDVSKWGFPKRTLEVGLAPQRV